MYWPSLWREREGGGGDGRWHMEGGDGRWHMEGGGDGRWHMEGGRRWKVA